jgi:hypothetical protein
MTFIVLFLYKFLHNTKPLKSHPHKKSYGSKQQIYQSKVLKMQGDTDYFWKGFKQSEMHGLQRNSCRTCRR